MLKISIISVFATDLSEHYQELGEKWFGGGIVFEKIKLK